MLRRFFAYYAPYKHLFFLDFGCAVLAGLLELAFPIAVQVFVDQLLPGQNWGLIAGAAALLLGVYILNTGLQAIVNYWGHVLGISSRPRCAARPSTTSRSSRFRFFDDNKTGQLITHVTKDLEEIGEVAHHGPEDLFIAIMTFIGAFALMFMVNWQLALMTTVDRAVHDLAGVDATAARMTRNWQSLFRRCRRLQRPHRGERRRHPRGQGLRQRGP